MSTAIIQGLQEVGATRVAVATAYNDEVNARLKAFLDEHSFTVLEVRGLGIEAVEDIFSVTQPQLIDFGADVVSASPGANSILVSCGGLRTLEILAPLEARAGVPAVSSTPHALYAGARLLHIDAHVDGYGALLSG
jgi:arylmalonate decarboxylase